MLNRLLPDGQIIHASLKFCRSGWVQDVRPGPYLHQQDVVEVLQQGRKNLQKALSELCYQGRSLFSSGKLLFIHRTKEGEHTSQLIAVIKKKKKPGAAV